MSNLAKLKAAADEKHAAFLATIATHFPGRAAADWYRAVAAIRGENVRRNDDTREDAALESVARARFKCLGGTSSTSVCSCRRPSMR